MSKIPRPPMAFTRTIIFLTPSKQFVRIYHFIILGPYWLYILLEILTEEYY